METTFIYTLSDPITGEIRYVGKTNCLRKRLYNHISRARKKTSNSHKNNWINKLLNENLKPKIDFLDEVPVEQWEDYEIYWIEQFKQWGFNLLNTCEGGEGAKTGPLSKSHKQKISNSVKKRFVEDPYYNRGEGNSKIIIDRDELYQKYILENLSQPKCAEYFNCSKKKINDSLKEYEIKKDKSVWKKQCANDYVQPTKTIIQYDKEMNFIKKWIGGLKEIEDELGINRSMISRVCNGQRNHSKGFVWKYENDIKS